RKDSPRARDLRGIAKTLVQWARLTDNVGPFRGALFGIESALLDVAGRALSLTVTELLGGRHQDPEVLPPLRILKSRADDAMAATTVRRAESEPRPVLWPDLDGRLRLPESLSVIDQLGQAAARGEMPAQTLIRRVVNVRDSYRMGTIRRAA